MEIVVNDALEAIKHGLKKTDWLVYNYSLILEYSIEDLNKAWQLALEKSSALQ